MEIPGYVIEKLIGEGGMARVYLALHKALNRKVAIKVMNRQHGADSDFNDRFLREARIVANLTHPNIVTIHDVGEHDGYNYLVMELLPSGETLSDKIKAGVDSQYALSIVRQVATALKAAHEKNIVHRDIKPDNIMFREDGSVVLMDFGVARSVDSAAVQVTQAGTIIGTPQYISPEQAEGKPIGTYSDIYSLGIVFYEMLTGKVPYTADTPIALVFKHVSSPIPVLFGNNTIYQPLLDRMMAKTREERYSNCDQIITDIDSIEAGKPLALATDTSSATDANRAREAAENLTLADIDSIGTGESEFAATEILYPPDSVEAGTDKIQPTEILSTAAIDKMKKAAPKAKIRKTHPVSRPKTSATKSRSLLWITLGLLISSGLYLFVDVDMGKLKTLVGLDPGPVYSRVGRLIAIPDGSFKIGNISGDLAENPEKTVRINGFKLGETEVTQKQWRLVMGHDTSHFKGCNDCPVDSVSWNDVQEFLKKLNEQTGLSFRLPSEAEWEYACRSAGKDEKYCGGNNESKLAWYGENSEEKTHPVAQKQANGLGLYDMSGNVWEWTQDCWQNSYTVASSDDQAWEQDTCTQRVLRGGSWIGVAGSLSSTDRFRSPAANSSQNFGFRVAHDM
jgi:serine/threonine protein kinase